MPDPYPMTLVQAQAGGGRRFTGTVQDLQNYGAPIQTWDCSTVPAGHACAVYSCVNNWRLIRYCDAALGCTEVYEVPC